MGAARAPAARRERVADLIEAGLVLANDGLATAFGHVSVRTTRGHLLITPPKPLGLLSIDDDFSDLPIDAPDLPPAVPKEAWIHVAIAQARADVGAICRAQPTVATALAYAATPIIALHGQGAFLGPHVPVFDDAVLVRDSARASRLADELGASPALIMRGNGAVTVGATLAEAVALMWVLEASARMNATAAAAGTPAPLTDDEQAAWKAVAPELLTRIWEHLRRTVGRGPGPTHKESS